MLIKNIDPMSQYGEEANMHPQGHRVDARRAERLRLQLPVRLAEATGDLRTGIQTETLDVSGSGMHFQHPVPLDGETAYQVELALPDHSEPLRFMAVVVRCTPGEADDGLYEIALEFKISSMQKRDFITYSQFIAAQLLDKHLE